MAFNLDSIKTGAKIRPPRMLVLGVEKIGKTSFACGCEFEGGSLKSVGNNNPIVLPVRGEEGADDIGVPLFPTAGSFGDITEAIATLCSGEHDFRTVVIDSSSALEPLIWDEVCKDHGAKSIEDVGGGYGKGYTEALRKWRTVTEGLDMLRSQGMASVIVGHVKVKRFDDPAGESYDTYLLDINDKASALLLRWADVILFANTKVVVKKEDVGFNKDKKRGIDVSVGQRFLHTQKRASHPGGGRGVYGRLPYELPLSWSAFEQAVAAASTTTKS